jgi:predicted ATP-dependent endonuclease of OLD family
MRFKELKVKNFRSIDQDGVTIEFDRDQNIASLIGPNGSGKSNIIAAIGIVLDSFPFNHFIPQESDYYLKDSENEINIELTLHEPIEDTNLYRRILNIYGFSYKAKRYTKGEKKGQLDREHYCIGDTGQVILKPQRLKKAKTKPDDGQDDSWKPVQVADISRRLGPLFYFDVPRLERFFSKTTGWGPLGRLFNIYRSDFDSDSNIFVKGGKKYLSRNALAKAASLLGDVLKTEKLQEIETTLSEKVSGYMGFGTDSPFKISLGLPSHRELFEQWVQLLVTEHENIPPLPIDSLGSGYKSLLQLATVEALVKLSDDVDRCILLFEEPEIYL